MNPFGMKKQTKLDKVKQTVGKIIYYGAVPLILFLGFRGFKEMENIDPNAIGMN